MADGRWLIEWMRIHGDKWHCLGPIGETEGFVVVGSRKFRTPVVIDCDRTKAASKPYVKSHMMGPGKDVLKSYDESFWERWFLPPGVHPLDVMEQVSNENKWCEEHHNAEDGDEE